ncbi:MAG: PolC-type DNA polymerase III [Firmicutes bacterium]|nr:PolC-type DNA polymerase III [Bacillota bacterium]
MNDELKRFFDSIKFTSDKFNDAKVKKVVYYSSLDRYEVTIIASSIVPKEEVDKLIEASKNKIKGEKACSIKIEYESFSMEEKRDYALNILNDYYKDKPSLGALALDINGDTIVIKLNSKMAEDMVKSDFNKLAKLLELYGLGQFNFITQLNVEALQSVKEEIEKEKTVEIKKEESPMVIGVHKDGEVTKLSNIFGEAKNLIFECYIFNIESVEKKGKKGPIYIISIKVSDKTDSYLIKLVKFSEEENAFIMKKLKPGTWIRVGGNVEMDTFLKCPIISPRSIEIIPSREEKIIDDAPVKRVELHAHTMMSMMDSVCDTKSLLKFAYGLGHRGIAITDHSVLQSYPDLYNTVKDLNKGKEDNEKFKVVYGAEMNVVDDNMTIIYNPKENLDLLDQTYVVFDTETTGLNSGVDSLIEIGGVKYKNGEIIDRFDELIDPKRKLPAFITKLTHITDEMLVGKDNEENVTKRFLKFCEGCILVAHNAEFDMGFVSAVMDKYNLGKFDYTVIDTMNLARNMYPSWRNHKLSTLVQNLEVDFNEDEHHRADYDSEGTAKCFHKMLLTLKNEKKATTDDLKNMVDKENIIKFARPFHMTILAQNAQGLKNLFKIVSLANTKYLLKGKEPKIPRQDIIDNREGLLFGSGCTFGEVFEKGLNLDDQGLANMMNFYDYIEVMPYSCATHLIGPEKRFGSVIEYNNYIEKLVEVAKRAGKLVCAVGDVHNIRKEDLIYRKVIINQKTNGKLHYLNHKDIEVPNEYFMTTNEMLEAFSFLEDKEDIVINNPNKLLDMVDELQIIKDKLYTPELENAAQRTKDMVYTKAHEVYGENLPELIETRLEQELNGIISGGFDVIYLIAQMLVKRSNEQGYFVGSRGSVGSSLVATMMGITEVNGLPPHYVCPKCKRSVFEVDGKRLADDYNSGYDMPDYTCECGEKMSKEGQDMPFATFLGFKAEKVPDIDLNFSGDNQASAHNHVKEIFGEQNAYRAGTISTVQLKTAFGYVRGYCEENNIIMNNYEIERIAMGCTGVKRTTGQHPGGIIVIPQYMNVFDFTPYQYPADEPDSTWYTTHFDFHAIHDNVLKLDILGHDDPTMLRYLGDTTGVDVKTIPFDDNAIISLFTSPDALKVTKDQILCPTGTLGIPEFGTNFAIQMLLEIKPTHFADLVKIAGLSHGTNVWQGNVRDLIVNSVATFDSVPGCRDDIMTSLINYGIESSSAFKISEFVRKGKAKKDPAGWLEHAKLMREYSVPEWYIECCRKIEYMFPKAHACAYVMMAYRVAWFKVYYPLYYYSAYFSIRRSDFDIDAMLGGYDGIKARLQEIKEKQFDVTAKEEAVADTLAVALEMHARGFKFKNIDIKKSQAKTFVIEEDDNALVIPFMAVDGLGENCAFKIVEEREQKEFFCIEDFAGRGKVNKTTVDKLRELHVFDGMPESAQLSLF